MPVARRKALAGQQCVVRRARAGDFAFAYRDPEIPAAAFRRMIREGDVLVATLARRRVGVARIEHLWGKTPFLTSLWVEPDCRRWGVARLLLRHVTSVVRGQGHDVLFSSTMPDNRASKAWHRAMGFSRCGFMSNVNPGGVGEVFYQLGLLRGTRGVGYGRA
jgi:ribosomal protein S18 acetylase RimI-like enzyme